MATPFEAWNFSVDVLTNEPPAEGNQVGDDVEMNDMAIEDEDAIDPINSLEELGGDVLDVMEVEHTAEDQGEGEEPDNEDEEE